MSSPVISNKTRTIEIIAVIATALGKFLFMDYLKWRLPFILTAIIFWIGYIIYRLSRNPEVTKHWGFRTDNFRIVIATILPFGIFALAVFVGIGLFQDTLNITWHILPILLLYPIWGVIQQFLLIALTAGNLYDFNNPRLSKSIVIILPALLFSLIHYPYTWLMIGTFVLALFYAFIYLKQRNIYALGIFHGWLGAFFFYTVVDRDPFLETFGGFLNLSK